MQAISMINSPMHRLRRAANASLPRRMRRIILTMPTAMPVTSATSCAPRPKPPRPGLPGAGLARVDYDDAQRWCSRPRRGCCATSSPRPRGDPALGRGHRDAGGVPVHADHADYWATRAPSSTTCAIRPTGRIRRRARPCGWAQLRPGRRHHRSGDHVALGRGARRQRDLAARTGVPRRLRPGRRRCAAARGPRARDRGDPAVAAPVGPRRRRRLRADSVAGRRPG